MTLQACTFLICGLVIIHLSFADESNIINKREWGDSFQRSYPLNWDDSLVDKQSGWDKNGPLNGIYDNNNEDISEEIDINSNKNLQNYKRFLENSINSLGNDVITKRRGWGKRAELDLDKRRGWGKRSDGEVDLDKRRGWGKRSVAEVSKRRGWGKRAVDAFDSLSAIVDKRRGWGKRSESLSGGNNNGIWTAGSADMLSSEKRGWGKRSTNSLSSRYRQLQEKLAIQTLSCDELKQLINKQILPDNQNVMKWEHQDYLHTIAAHLVESLCFVTKSGHDSVSV